MCLVHVHWHCVGTNWTPTSIHIALLVHMTYDKMGIHVAGLWGYNNVGAPWEPLLKPFYFMTGCFNVCPNAHLRLMDNGVTWYWSGESVMICKNMSFFILAMISRDFAMISRDSHKSKTIEWNGKCLDMKIILFTHICFVGSYALLSQKQYVVEKVHYSDRELYWKICLYAHTWFSICQILCDI